MDTFNDPWASPPNLEGLSSDQMDSLAELHEGPFEPQIRARSNTWPLPKPENFVEPGDENESNNQKTNNQQSSGEYTQKVSNFFSIIMMMMTKHYQSVTIKIYGSLSLVSP
jgi:hypothetical protein